MAGWRQRVDELLYEGEEVREHVEFDASTVVVTSHRMLAFRPDADGANFRQVDRPNVDGVSTGANSKTTLIERALRFGLTGAVLIVAGYVIDLEGLIGGVDLNSQSTSELGLGGILGTLQGMLNLLTRLDELLQLFGALALLLAVVVFGVYWYTREETVVIEVAGDEDVHIPRPPDAADTVERLEQAIAPETAEEKEIPRDPLQES